MSVESDGIDHEEERDEPQMTQISVEFPFKSVSATFLSPLCLLWPNIPPHPVREAILFIHVQFPILPTFSLSNLCVLRVLCG